MKVFKNLMIGIVVIVAVLMIVAFLLPKGYKIERKTTVNAPVSNVFAPIGDLSKWDQWTPWKAADPEAVYTYSEKTSGAGAWMEWKGKKIGTGKLTLTRYTNNEMVTYSLQFMKPYAFETRGKIALEENKDAVDVTWTDEGDFAWPLGRLFGLFNNMEKSMGPDFEQSLAKLKTIAESMPVTEVPAIEVEIRTLPPTLIAGIRQKTTLEAISPQISSSYGKIMEYLSKSGVQPVEAPPLCIYHEFGPAAIDMEPAIVVPSGTTGKDDIVVHPMYEGTAMVVRYAGDYALMEPTYNAMEEWMKEHNKTSAGAPWESYITDPEMEKDTAKWITEIFWPIR